jgi:hypothetical protein
MSRTSPILRLLVVVGLNAPLLACGGTPPASPPATPTLVKGALLGDRACGPYTIHQRALAFTCGPLPTTAQTGWQLRPLLKPPNSQGTQWTNRVILLTVTTATTTNLAVTYVTENGVIWPMRAIPDGPGEPAPVTGRHQFAFAAQDDGTTKTWTLKFILDSCTTDAEVRMAATNATGSSAPLSAILMRDPNELECTSFGGGGVWAMSGSPSGPRPPSGPTNGPCPGGAQPRMFGVCENCATNHPPSMNRWSGGQYCDEAEVRAVYGYSDPILNPTPKAQVCTMRIEPNRENCERP